MSPATSTGGPVALAPVAYPMVDESAAAGRVAAVYSAVLDRLPMVPSLFKSLAINAAYLELAWAQTEPMLDDGGFRSAAGELVHRARGAVPAPDDPSVRDAVGGFVAPLARMLLVAAGLRAGLDGTLVGPPAAPGSLPDPGPLRPGLDVPSTDRLPAALVGTIRRDLATPIVNSVWRVAADRGVLEQAWSHFGPRTRGPDFARNAGELRSLAWEAATTLRWSAVASPTALERCGLTDDAAGVATVLEAYLSTLPRVLALVASSGPESGDD